MEVYSPNGDTTQNIHNHNKTILVLKSYGLILQIPHEKRTPQTSSEYTWCNSSTPRWEELIGMTWCLLALLALYVAWWQASLVIGLRTPPIVVKSLGYPNGWWPTLTGPQTVPSSQGRFKNGFRTKEFLVVLTLLHTIDDIDVFFPWLAD
jgi:hypothetical protein